MDKLKTSALGGFPFVLDDIRQFLGRLTSPANHGIYQAFNNIIRGFGDNFIVQGVVLSGSTGAFSITEGWVLLDGELVKVDAQGPFDEANDSKFVKVTTFDPRGNKSFLNGSIADTYEKNRAVVQGTSGNLNFDANTFFELSNQADSLPDIGTKVLRKKIIEIGDWNMDSISGINVTHGISDFLKIRSIEVMIINDAQTLITNLDAFTAGGAEGGISAVNSALVTLNRRTSGIFDSTIYDETPLNRGFITIEFEA